MNNNNKVVNLNYLAELSSGNEAFIKDMIAIFLTENPQELKQLEAAIIEGDFDKIKAVAHHMKSTIVFMGLDIIIGNDLSEVEELSGKKENLTVIKLLFKKIKTICETAFNELNI